jgi:hypothetical protein
MTKNETKKNITFLSFLRIHIDNQTFLINYATRSKLCKLQQKKKKKNTKQFTYCFDCIIQLSLYCCISRLCQNVVGSSFVLQNISFEMTNFSKNKIIITASASRMRCFNLATFSCTRCSTFA